MYMLGKAQNPNLDKIVKLEYIYVQFRILHN